MAKIFAWIAAVLIALLALVYAVCPDPFPIAVDDIVAVLVAATSIGVVIKKTVNPSKRKQLNTENYNSHIDK